MIARGTEAIAAALSIFERPQLARLARTRPLPSGVTFLLETAAGDAEALAYAMASTGRSEPTIKQAAEFFVEQILLSPNSDSYRILGGDNKSPEPELRRNMALLMCWLHPDLAQGQTGEPFDKSAYATRISQAWECVKTPERRASYDARLKARGMYLKARSAYAPVGPMRRRERLGAPSFLNRLLLRIITSSRH
jgi:hypothetical protein